MKKLLIIEDDLKFASFVTNLLKSNDDFEVHHAEKGMQGIKLYEEVKPDCVLLDGKLPDMDGAVVFNKIKEIDNTAKIIILSATISANSGMHEKNPFLNLDAAGFIPKPFKPDFLNDVLDSVLYENE